jgi:YEATS domain-containing protein 4
VRTQEPYRTQDDDWGEFEAQVDVYPKCSVWFTLVCHITFPAPNSKKPALLERREERVVLRNPPPILYEGLTAAAFTWNRFKRIKKQPKAADADVIEGPASDPSLEEKWLNAVSAASTAIRTEIQK